MNQQHIQELWNSIIEYHKKNYPYGERKGFVSQFLETIKSTAPATEEELISIENLFEITLPDDFKDSYQISYSEIGGFLYLYSPSEIIENTNNRSEQSRNILKEEFGEFTNAKEMLARYCEGKILEHCPYSIESSQIKQPTVMWPMEWIVFGMYLDTYDLIVDLREEMKELRGSIIAYDIECNSLMFCYPNFTSFLEDATQQLLEKGPYQFDIQFH